MREIEEEFVMQDRRIQRLKQERDEANERANRLEAENEELRQKLTAWGKNG